MSAAIKCGHVLSPETYKSTNLVKGQVPSLHQMLGFYITQFLVKTAFDNHDDFMKLILKTFQPSIHIYFLHPIKTNILSKFVTHWFKL